MCCFGCRICGDFGVLLGPSLAYCLVFVKLKAPKFKENVYFFSEKKGLDISRLSYFFLH